MATTSPKEGLDNLKLTKREDGKFYDLEANYKNYIIKGIVGLDEFTFKLEPFPENLIACATRLANFIKFNFIPDKTNVLLKVITKETTEDD